MVLRIVSLGVVFLVCLPCAAKPACTPATDFDQPVKLNRDLAQILRKAQSGDKDAQFQAGVEYETGCRTAQDYEQAALWYRRAADRGHLGAQNNLGGLYLQGRGVEPGTKAG